MPSGGRAETGSASPSPASIAAVTVLTKSGAASETTGGRFGLLAFTGWSGTSASDSRARPAPASCAPPAPDLYCCSFWRWLPAVPPARYHPAGSGLNGKGHLHHGINARPEAAFAGDLCRIDHVKTRFF
ncbi:hypothetical protein M3O75_08615 [Klebsiella pneumoniae]|nr:hypothetical protein [Klebsiella pneumoniae]